ncbi:MAG: prepilin-type N-terminal cleavage/methylation domain-containing protein [Planctomycetes bacterium]|nr:prepilin-type N-terminal cleavage/methylation domain-containing protein [Planctomycetota bacterium]
MDGGAVELTGRLERRSMRSRKSAFSLVELVIVVVIIGIIAGIAVPRIGSASAGADAAALKTTLSAVRRAIDHYYAEHGQYPGYLPGTTTPNDAAFSEQLLQYTDLAGARSTTYGDPYFYGPYLRAPFPANPFNDLSTVRVKAAPGDDNPAAGSVGWVAVLSHGYFGILATAGELDKIGIKDADAQKRMNLTD